jgi:hypothetical protein
MKILYLTGNGEDYLSDLSLHGLTSLNHEIDLVNKKDFLFDDFPSKKTNQLYGMGFTYSALISNDKVNTISLNEARKKIKSKNYDLIVFPEVHKFSRFLLYSIINKNKVAVMDGEDDVFFSITKQYFAYSILYSIKNLSLAPIFRFYIKTKVLFYLHGKRVTFFKRELLPNQNAFPISFAIPEEKINKEAFKKNRFMSILNPCVRETYIYNNEFDYYKGYKDSYFGLTKKKGGWDCLRHYEILANDCIPYFPDLISCPVTTMMNFPKNLIFEANELYEKTIDKWNEREWFELHEKLRIFTINELTTKKLAEYIINKSIKS